MRFKFKKVVIFSLIIFTPFSILLAQGNVPAPCDVQEPGKIWNPIKVCSLVDFVKTILEGVIKIGIPIIALAIVYSGFLFVAARGNAEKINKAKRALLYTVIGAAILLGSWAIAKLISDTVLELGIIDLTDFL